MVGWWPQERGLCEHTSCIEATLRASVCLSFTCNYFGPKVRCRDTSLIRHRAPIGPYSTCTFLPSHRHRSMPRDRASFLPSHPQLPMPSAHATQKKEPTQSSLFPLPEDRFRAPQIHEQEVKSTILKTTQNQTKQNGFTERGRARSKPAQP